ncbi:MAG: thiamine pyrophosphate-dependent enzyme [Bacteroidales bacterium]|nr:thiamine pyrophosphate-dependent enzyme [Bacteroidales bacterium]
MKESLLLGAEAVALGAIDAGISGVYAYPGTPSTEITEYIQKSKDAKEKNIRSKWCSNEKTAYEAALGMSYAGKRSIVCMKHVGLNACADAFMNSAITGVHGGLVLVVADDPSQHSSQNEQDSRYYGKFALLPVLEPSTQQEAYECVHYGLDLSEKYELPCILRITTRLSHSRSVISNRKKREQNAFNPIYNPKKWITLPGFAKPMYRSLVAKQDALTSEAENSPFLKLIEGTGKKAVIACGLAYNYVMEIRQSYNLDFAVLKISQYPLPNKQIAEFLNKYDDILIAEEGYPIVEEYLRGFLNNPKIKGKLDGALNRTGELNPDVMALALGVEPIKTAETPDFMVNRPPALCKGCSHRDTFEALNNALSQYTERHVFGDIGCYTLGALKPFESLATTVDMGASITMAKGAADAGLHPSVAVIGDSTFTHSGMPGLLDAVNEKSKMTVIISDNSTTAMTGGQDSAGTSKIHLICKGLGVEEEHIRVIVPLKANLEKNIAILKEEFEYNGVSVILAQRECVQTAIRNKKKQKKA